MDVVVFDIDGVLSDNSSYKGWFDKGGDFVPEKFEEEILSFKVNSWAKHLLEAINITSEVVLLTSRRNSFRDKTIAWLRSNELFYDQLFTNDEKKDFVEHKLSVLKLLEDRGYDIKFIVEDNPELVCAMRKAGYVVLQPNHLYGDCDE